MRIISGELRGRRLKTVPDNTVRPATDQVRGAVFNILQNRIPVHGAEILDLFAGSGSLGFEAISRGAKRVTFIESSGRVADFIEQNAEELDCTDRCTVFTMSAFDYISRCSEKFDLVFADPPYRQETTPELPTMIFARGIVRPEGYLIIEHTKHVTFPESATYQRTLVREFGGTILSFFIHPVS
jgi:16S rRNA (guanine(966)-N(2))-methyltransferase RsmD